MLNQIWLKRALAQVQRELACNKFIGSLEPFSAENMVKAPILALLSAK